MRWQRCLIVGLCLAVLALGLGWLLGRTYTWQVELPAAVPSVDDLTIGKGLEADAIAITDVRLDGNRLSITVCAAGTGRAYIDVRSAYFDTVPTVTLHAHPSGIVTADGFFGKSNGSVVFPLAALAFFAAMAVCYRLYRALYEPETARRRSEQEVFDAFCLHHDLSDREREILRLMLDRRTNAEIAEALFISENTVKYHVRNVLQKAGCKNRGELQRKYTLALYPGLQSEKAEQ